MQERIVSMKGNLNLIATEGKNYGHGTRPFVALVKNRESMLAGFESDPFAYYACSLALSGKEGGVIKCAIKVSYRA